MNEENAHAGSREMSAARHIVGHVVITIALAFLFGAIVMWLWNRLLPVLFSFKLIGYWQGVGLVVLARLLFGSIGFGRHRRADFSPRAFSHHQHRLHHAGHWNSYNAWWQSEGRQAFEAYVARAREPETQQGQNSEQ